MYPRWRSWPPWGCLRCQSRPRPPWGKSVRRCRTVKIPPNLGLGGGFSWRVLAGWCKIRPFQHDIRNIFTPFTFGPRVLQKFVVFSKAFISRKVTKFIGGEYLEVNTIFFQQFWLCHTQEAISVDVEPPRLYVWDLDKPRWLVARWIQTETIPLGGVG